LTENFWWKGLRLYPLQQARFAHTTITGNVEE
jgi:hypothetical protein